MTDTGDQPTWYLLAQRPGWRGLASLTDLAFVDGSLQLRSLAPPPPPPSATCTVTGCGDLAVVDRANKQIAFISAAGQPRLVVGPVALVADDPPRVDGATPQRRLDPTDVLPVLVWPTGTWSPVAVSPAGRGRVWVLDTANDCLHEIDRRVGWVSKVDGDVPPNPPGCEPAPVAPFVARGRVVLGPLDSGLEACVWDRVVVNGELPPGGRIELRTVTSDVAYTEAEMGLLDDGSWTPSGAQTTPGSEAWDALVQSVPGRLLWLEITLSGDGAVTPRVDDVEVHFPRQTSGRYLPAAYRGGPDGGAFLDEFCALTDTMRRSVTTHVVDTPLLLDPDSTPADPARDFLAWLSGWLGVDDAEALPVGRRRRLLAAAAELYRLRGTPEGVRRHVGLWLGRPVDLLEHYRLRRWAVVHHGRLGDTSRLFGPEIVRRLQLDEFSTVGAVRLVDVPDPLRDPFHFYAHRFTLIARACRTDDSDDLADRAAHIVSIVAPAHSSAEICVVRPELRIGVQATIGLDALVGAAPDPEPLGDGKLGHALVLGADPTRTGPGLGHDTRVARTTVG